MTLNELIDTVRSRPLPIVLGALLGLGIGVVLSLTLTRYYRATMVVAPVPDPVSGSGDLASLAGRLGGLASIAGINIGRDEVSRGAITIETLRGRTYLVNFIRRRGLVAPLFVGRGFDADSAKWELDPSQYDPVSDRWKGWRWRDRPQGPSDSMIFKEASKRITVDEDRRSGLLRLSVDARAPQASVQLLNWLVLDLNDFLRSRDTEDAMRTISYLQVQASETQISEMKGIFYRLIEEQTKKLMLARVQSEYALKIVDASIVPDRAAYPKRSLLWLAGLVGGASIGLLFSLYRNRAGREGSRN